jgi:hypothetical protein
LGVAAAFGGAGLTVAALGSVAASAQTTPVVSPSSAPVVTPSSTPVSTTTPPVAPTPVVTKLHHHKSRHSGHIVAAATATVTVTPDTGLTNNQVVTVSVTGFGPNAITVVIIECAPPPTPAQQQAYCNTGNIVLFPVPATGSASHTFTVKTGATGKGNCGAPGSADCHLTVANIAGTNTPNATQNIVFASQTTTTTSSTTSTTTGTHTTPGATTGSTTTVASGSTTGSSSGSSTGSSSSGSTGSSGSTSSSHDATLAGTGAPTDTVLMGEIALVLIGAGAAVTIAARRRRHPATASRQR